MNSHYCGPQTVGILRNHQRLIKIGLVLSEFTNQERECLRQEPYLVLASTTTILLDVPVELNFCYEPNACLSSSRVKYCQKLRLCTASVMDYSKYGIWMTPYWVISITSPYELYMWKVIFLCDGEIWVAHLPQAVNTSIES